MEISITEKQKIVFEVICTEEELTFEQALEYLDKCQVDQEDNVDWPRHMSDTEDENRKEGKTCTCKCE